MPLTAAQTQFIQDAVIPAQTSQFETSVPTSVTLAQAILESGWGVHHIGDANNYFGIKAWRRSDGSVDFGAIAVGYIEVPTKEEINGQLVTVVALFRKYLSMTDSFRDHGHFLRDNANYAEAFNHTDDPNEFARQLQKARYATASNYAAQLISVMKSNDLYQYESSSSASTLPVIESVTPTSGPLAGQTPITILGRGFGGATIVAFGSLDAPDFTVVSDNQISVTSPAADISEPVHIAITTDDGTSTPWPNDQFTYIIAPMAAPTVTRLAPATGPGDGGTSVVITGTDFSDLVSVNFGLIPASSFSGDSDTQITAVSPLANLSGTVEVQVTTNIGTSDLTSASQFIYTTAPGPVPSIARLTPVSGPADGETSVVIAGTGFHEVVSVNFGAISASSFSVDSDTQITAFSPPVNMSGIVDVTVITSAGISNITLDTQFTYE